MTLPEGKKIYFASDFHLGFPSYAETIDRERRIVAWLEEAAQDAAEVFLVGDLFDFWFEYKRAVPKGFTRLIAAIGRLVDRGIPVHIYVGNHDLWMWDYLPIETGAQVYRKPIHREWNGQRFYIAHGDGLGPGDHGYKFLKRIFTNKVCQWLFHRLHPNFGVWLALKSSDTSRNAKPDEEKSFLGEDREWLIQHSKNVLAEQHFHHFVYGHRHVPMTFDLGQGSQYVNLGDWIGHNTYAMFDGQQLELLTYGKPGA